ncbi:MAG: ABC transporter ATP-binding protein [Gammaproteobacteria bacterium]|nr:ABC transporter ATP-binding protein [Gammaproteobacteria bacterium]
MDTTITQSIISVRDLSKCYWIGKVPFPALNRVNLEIYDNDFTVLAGRSGSGKSTLLNIVGALESADTGEVVVDNQNILQMSADQRTQFRLQTIGFVFQAYNLIQVLTAQENVAYVCRLQGKSKLESLEIAAHWLDAVGLGELGSRRPNQLSGGQQQRVAVARALATNPKIVLADEPTANLDTVTAQKLVCLLQKLHDDFNTTFLISSHDPDVKNASSRLIKLSDGHVIKRWDEALPPADPTQLSCPIKNLSLSQRLRRLFEGNPAQ